MRAARRNSRRAGTAMIEFALGFTVLVTVFAGTFQFGYTFFQYNNLQNAVASGARYASLIPYDSATANPSSTFSDAVKQMVVYGRPTGGTIPVVRNLGTSNVVLTVTFANGVPALMTVAVTGFRIDSVFSTTTLTNKPLVTYTYQGIWSPI